MSDSAVKVEGVGKRYRIGETQRPAYGTLRDALTSFARRQADRLRHPFRQRRSRESTIWALRDVSFEIRRGEVVGIIGRNGAGKSTLLKILSRITEPTEGRVTLHGRVGSLLEVGTGFHLELTGRENIFLNGAILGMKKAEIQRKFDEIVAFAEIDRFIDTPVKHYSSGMHVRLAFAVAAHLEPEILLIDEVLAVGDASFQKKCLGKMGQVAGEGRTVLFVSHNMLAVEGLCQRGLWLEAGSVELMGDTNEVVRGYLRLAAENSTERTWATPNEAPGASGVHLRRVRVASAADARFPDFRVDQPIDITVEFWNLRAGARLTVTLHLLTAEGIVAFSTSTFHSEEEWEGRGFPAGVFRCRCTVPAHLLNAASYGARILLVEDQGKVLFSYDNAVFFTVSSSPSPRRTYFGARPGILAPLLQWRTEMLEADPR